MLSAGRPGRRRYADLASEKRALAPTQMGSVGMVVVVARGTAVVGALVRRNLSFRKPRATWGSQIFRLLAGRNQCVRVLRREGMRTNSARFAGTVTS